MKDQFTDSKAVVHILLGFNGEKKKKVIHSQNASQGSQG